MFLRRLACAVALSLGLCSAAVAAQQTGPPPGATAPEASSTADEAQYGPLKKVGGAVKAPVVTHQAEPQFSKEARKKKVSGVVLIGMIVDREGKPQEVHVIRGIGMGLDENALKAVSQYRFKPAMEDGVPVAVRINVEVNFQFFDNKEDAAAAAAAVRKGGTASDHTGQPASGASDSSSDYQ